MGTWYGSRQQYGCWSYFAVVGRVLRNSYVFVRVRMHDVWKSELCVFVSA
jgi:hypothetical protein